MGEQKEHEPHSPRIATEEHRLIPRHSVRRYGKKETVFLLTLRPFFAILSKRWRLHLLRFTLYVLVFHRILRALRVSVSIQSNEEEDNRYER
jgi:hypothetical protein